MTLTADSTGLNLLLTIGRDLLSNTGLDDLLTRFLSHTLTLTGHESGSILLYTGDRRMVEVRASLGREAIPVGSSIPEFPYRGSGYVLTNTRPLILRRHSVAEGALRQDRPCYMTAVVCLPLILPDRPPVGLLMLSGADPAREIAAEDLSALEILVAQLALITESARLLDERSMLLQDLASRELKLQELIGRLLTAQEEERRRIAYDLHDGIAQMAASAYQHLQNVASRYHPRDPLIRSNLTQSLDLLRRAVKEARALMAGLRPTALDDLGLIVALELELEALREHGWDVSLVEDDPLGRLPATIETTLFRAAQEALNNIQKHAGATRVQLSLQRRNGMVRMLVRDWGVGFDASAIRRRHGERMGILGMQERASLLGGHCLIESEPGCGTQVLVEIPIKD